LALSSALPSSSSSVSRKSRHPHRHPPYHRDRLASQYLRLYSHPLSPTDASTPAAVATTVSAPTPAQHGWLLPPETLPPTNQATNNPTAETKATTASNHHHPSTPPTRRTTATLVPNQLPVNSRMVSSSSNQRMPTALMLASTRLLLARLLRRLEKFLFPVGEMKRVDWVSGRATVHSAFLSRLSLLRVN
jgi:hypothetical protein